MYRMTKPLMAAPLIAAVAVLLLAAPFSYAGGSSEKKPAQQKEQTAAPTPQTPAAVPAASPQTPAVPAQPAPPPNPFYTGDGGRGKSITILPPKGANLAANQAHFPELVANELMSNFKDFSAMTLFDRVNNQKQYEELLSGFYADDDKAGLDLGHLLSTDLMLLGTITRIASGFTLQLTVNSNSDKTTTATFSGTVSIAELENLTGVRQASLELLQKLGIQVTEKTREELTRAAAAERVNAQTAAARGLVAQHLGNTAEALTQFNLAAAYDSTLNEAVARSNAMSTSVRTGSLGQNIRNDIARRDEWVKILADAQRSLNNIPAPPRPPAFPQNVAVAYIIIPEPKFTEGEINYNAKTVQLIADFDIEESLFGAYYPAEYLTALDAYHAAFQARGDVYNKIVADINAGLNATGRNSAWELTELKPIERNAPAIIPRTETVEITAVVELLNDTGRVIGSIGNAARFGRVSFRERDTLINNVLDIQFTFTVKADDITERMALRVNANATPARGNLVQVMTSAEKQARPDLRLGSTFEVKGFVRIKGGTFTMGDDNETQRQVTVSSFYMSKTEVTQKEWFEVMRTTIQQQKATSYPSRNLNGEGDNYPMYYLSWLDAVKYCNALSRKEGLTPVYTIYGSVDNWRVTWNRNANGYRLPTEAEWEYACRAGTTTAFNTGANISDNTGWYSANSGNTTHPVGQKPANRWGLHDMHGNVSEWCWDRSGSYPRSGTQTDPTGTDEPGGATYGSMRVFRGGGWGSSAESVRSAYRLNSTFYPDRRDPYIGFRPVRPTIQPQKNTAPEGFVRVEGGTFQMGVNYYKPFLGPEHTVTVSSFYMGKYEVTQKEWTAVMGNNPSEFKGDNLPVEQVSWFDAVEFCNKLSQKEGLTPAYTISGSGNNRTVTWNRNANGYRLPTEAEWEYAARGGNGSPRDFQYAGSNNVYEVAWMRDNSGRRTRDVGTKLPSGLGLYDMNGNVAEWCWDWAGSYSGDAQTDPRGASSGSNRIVRGGNWSYSAEDVSSVYRSEGIPSARSGALGFRLVRPLDNE